MESSNSASATIPFKSKKPLLTTPIKNTTKGNPISVDPTAVATPDKANPNPTTRARSKNYAMSVSDVRRMAQQLQKAGISGSGLQKSGHHEKVLGNGVVAQKSKGSENVNPLLPEKYEMLCKFFNSMVSSVQLLRMKRIPPTFSKLARSVESLTDRRFTLHHLAQLKYIVPEAIVLKKMRVQDEETKCMKEDIHVLLDTDVLETDKKAKGGGKYSQLKDIFRARIVDLSKAHPENDDVPEGELPQLFYKPKQESEPMMDRNPAPLTTSLTAPSFKKRFSSRLGASLPESTLSKPSLPRVSETPVKAVASSEADTAPLEPASTPAKLASVPTKLASTPVELASTPARLMAATPSLRKPKRSQMTPDHDTSELPNTSAKRSRSLKFDESSDDIDSSLSKVDEEDSNVPAQGSIRPKDDVLELLPEGLAQSLKEKEQKILIEKNPIVMQAKSRQKLMAGVPKLFDMIYLLFQSIQRSVITKEELVYKLVTGHMDVVDKNEIEEQLKLLQEVAPEYISEQLSLSGDTLLRLNKVSCADSIRAKLLQAKLDCKVLEV